MSSKSYSYGYVTDQNWRLQKSAILRIKFAQCKERGILLFIKLLKAKRVMWLSWTIYHLRTGKRVGSSDGATIWWILYSTRLFSKLITFIAASSRVHLRKALTFLHRFRHFYSKTTSWHSCKFFSSFRTVHNQAVFLRQTFYTAHQPSTICPGLQSSFQTYCNTGSAYRRSSSTDVGSVRTD